MRSMFGVYESCILWALGPVACEAPQATVDRQTIKPKPCKWEPLARNKGDLGVSKVWFRA